MQIDRRHTTLSNGIQVVTDHAPHFQSVAISVSFRIGSVHEPDEKSGISHLLEHLVFRGSETRSGDDIQTAFGQLGGYLNAQTDEDSTTFKAITLTADLGEALNLISEIVTNPRLDDADLAMEKQIIEQENCRGCYNCSMRDSMFSASFPDQSIRNPVIGYEDTLEGLTRDDLVAFHRAAYVGRNLTVAICGAIPHDEVVRLVEASFASLPEGTEAGFPDFHFEPGEMLLTSGVDRGTLRLVYPLTGLPLQRQRATVFFHDILGGHPKSRLMDELREKRGLVYGAWADEYDVARESMLMIEAAGEARRMPEIAQIMANTLRETAETLTEEELAMAKRRMHAGAHMSLDSNTGRVEEIRHQISQHGKLVDWNARYEGYMSLSVQDVRAAGQALLDMAPTIIAAGPVRSVPKFSVIRDMLAGTVIQSSEKPKGIFNFAV
ncbi:MAG: insulinase family protein [Rhodobacteraceae bacterium]|nr:insulinase family protein [Paracoccaceae bacterium]